MMFSKAGGLQPVSPSAKAARVILPLLLPRALVLFSVLISLAMIARVYQSLSPTYDEPQHIANGVSWLGPPPLPA